MMRMIFSLMDADGDGKLTLQEFRAAHKRIFKAMDTDHMWVDIIAPALLKACPIARAALQCSPRSFALHPSSAISLLIAAPARSRKM